MTTEYTEFIGHLEETAEWATRPDTPVLPKPIADRLNRIINDNEEARMELAQGVMDQEWRDSLAKVPCSRCHTPHHEVCREPFPNGQCCNCAAMRA